MMQQWQISLYADDAVAGLDAAFTQPSWDFRGMFPAVPGSPGPYPLDAGVLTLSNDVTRSISLRGGSGAFLRFGIASGREASIRVTSAGVVAPVAVQAIVMRTR